MIARETKRGGRGNIYRLGHFLKALHNIEDSVRGFKGDDMSTAIQIRAAIDTNFTSGNPGDKLRKVIDAYIERGTLPKYPVSKLRPNKGFDTVYYWNGKWRAAAPLPPPLGKGETLDEMKAAVERTGYVAVLGAAARGAPKAPPWRLQQNSRRRTSRRR